MRLVLESWRFQGILAFPLAEESQEAYYFLTQLGVLTPTRFIQGSTDSAHAFQAGMMEVFEDRLYICVLIWIDDVLRVHSKLQRPPDPFGGSISKASKVQRQIESSKDRPLLQGDHLVWQKNFCWRYQVMIESFLSLLEPENAANLQKFLCGATWIRSSILSMQWR